MDPRLLRYYERELQFVREMGAEYAAEYPKIASRLTLQGLDCADPYVERLLEGFAFLAARVQLKLDAEFPRLTQHLLESVCPNYLAPTPSMAVVQLVPDFGKGSLATGYLVARDTPIRTPRGKTGEAACEFRTAHDVVLWPVTLVEASHAPYSRELGGDEAASLHQVRSAVRLKLRAGAGMTFDKLPMDRLVVHLTGAGDIPARLHEQILAGAAGVLVRSVKDPKRRVRLPARSVRRYGFDDDQAMLPYGRRAFQGYRLLHEYFAMPERFLFFEIEGLQAALRGMSDAEVEIAILLTQNDATLHNLVDAGNFALNCTPAVNLFPVAADTIHLTERQFECHVVPDRNQPMDYEVWDVTEVTGSGAHERDTVRFAPFYSVPERRARAPELRYFTTHREPRLPSESQRRKGARSRYLGTEVFLSLVDAAEAPWPSELKQLGVKVLCTNRDLPLFLALGQGRTGFTIASDAPLSEIRCLVGPTEPQPSFVLQADDPSRSGEIAWRLVNHLSLNYLSLVDSAGGKGAEAMRELLSLYVPAGSATAVKQVEGLRSIDSRAVVRRIHGAGPLAFGRGLEVTVTFDDAAFTGSGAFLLGAVLEDFFARHVSINSFTETRIVTQERGELIRWPVRSGRRHTL
jgi:type VI secretion system protein ImpG